MIRNYRKKEQVQAVQFDGTNVQECLDFIGLSVDNQVIHMPTTPPTDRLGSCIALKIGDFVVKNKRGAVESFSEDYFNCYWETFND